MSGDTENEREEEFYRFEGWLNVWEVDSHAEANIFREGRTPRPIWEPHFCVCNEEDRRFSHHRTEKAADEKRNAVKLPRQRLDGSKAEFDKRWGYEALESIKENAIHHTFPFSSLEVFSRSQTLDNRNGTSKDSVYERGLGERRGSVPVVSAAVQDENMADPPSTPSRLASFFSRKVIKSNLKRTKSVTKLDRKRPTQNDLEGSPNLVSTLKRSMSLGRLTKRWSSKQRPTFDDSHCKSPARTPYDNRELINARMRTSRSHESLLTTHSAMHSIDLAGKEVEIKPLHSSILGQEHCFQVSTSHGSKYYSCRTAEERQKWIQCLRKTVHPDQEKTRRTENSLKIWILEAKNVAPKKRYFCELCLDKALYARTSTLQKNDMLFWGENFDFSNLPDIETITVNLYREADKKKKKEKNCLLGYINIPVAEITNRQLVEKWYTASSAYVGRGKENKSDLPLLRVKARYQTVNILPMDCYQDFLQYLQNNYMSLVEILEPVVSVKAKEELASCLVRVMHRLSQPATFLADIVMAEMDKLDNENLTFRGNSIATKAMEAYMKLIGERYLQDTLGDFVRTLLESPDDCEVDPARLGGNNATLQRHQANLVMYCEMAWFKIINSYCFFPLELRDVFCTVKERCQEKKQADVSDNLISSCIFLRFLCPSILSPSLFNLTQSFPQDRSARNLTLIAKTIQNLANFTKFGAKEDYMTFMNDFVEREFDSMCHYLQKISSRDTQTAAQEFDGYVDLGRELSLLHSILVESLEKINNDSSQQKLSKLSEILEEISEILANPNLTLRKSSKANAGAYRIYDNVSALRQQQQQANYQDANLSNSTDSMGPASQTRSQAIVSGSYAHGSNQAAAPDLTTADDYVMFSAISGQPSACSVQASATPRRLNEQEVNQSWSKIVSAANMVNGDYIDLVSFMDEFESQNSSTELDNGSQVSIGQLSTVASSGYQSFGYSQSSSPVDSGVQADMVTPVSQPLSFANPLFGHSQTSQTGTMSSSGSSTRERKQRTASSSSLSSEESSPIHSSHPHPHVTKGALPPPASSSLSHPHESTPHPHHPPHEHPHRQVPKNLSCSSSSCESLKDLKCQSPTQPHGHMNGRSVPNGSQAAASAEAGPLAHSQSVSGRSRSQQRSNFNNLRESHRSHSPHSYQSQTWSKSYKGSPLSRSIDLGQPLSRQNAPSPTMYHSQPPPPSPHHYKPLVTETLVIPPSPASPAIDHAPVYGPRRTAVPQNTVRMGVRSVQRRHNDIEKSKAEYEQELSSLRQQLAVTQAMLAEAQAKLMTQDAAKEEGEWSEEQQGSTENFEQIIDSLQEELEVKEQKIHDQERQIHQLDAANAQLMAVVNQLKDMPPISRNGLLATSTKLSLADSGQFKSSSC